MAVSLVVEDYAGLRSVVCQHLAGRGHTPVPASAGAEALKQATRRSPSVAPLDLRLPDTDGLELFNALRHERPSIVGVIMAAYASVPSAVECLHAGISEYVEKPFDLDALTLVIERLVKVPARDLEQSGIRAMVVPSYRRLALTVVCEIEDQSSITSFPAWGRAAGAAESTVRSW
jgi:DNA-binding NtrC family response regulator